MPCSKNYTFTLTKKECATSKHADFSMRTTKKDRYGKKDFSNSYFCTKLDSN